MVRRISVACLMLGTAFSWHSLNAAEIHSISVAFESIIILYRTLEKFYLVDGCSWEWVEDSLKSYVLYFLHAQNFCLEFLAWKLLRISLFPFWKERPCSGLRRLVISWTTFRLDLSKSVNESCFMAVIFYSALGIWKIISSWTIWHKYYEIVPNAIQPSSFLLDLCLVLWWSSFQSSIFLRIKLKNTYIS